MTAADAFGNVVATTQTINNLFGAKILIPGLGTVPNNYMNLYDPAARPRAVAGAGQARHHLDVADDGAARRQAASMRSACPAGSGSSRARMQALINLIDHGMSLQEAVEAPRVWTEGNALEVEQAVPESVRAKLAAMGHKVLAVPTVAGGMNAHRSFMTTAGCRARPAGAPTARRSASPAGSRGRV